MALRVNSNLIAINAARNLSRTTEALAKSVERLSSGLRINRAADDAAGLAISEKLRAQIRGLLQAQRNAQDGISLIQTAEGALSSIHSMLQRMRELAVQASNDTLSSEERQAIQAEIEQLAAEIDRTVDTTRFGTIHLLRGGLSSIGPGAVTLSDGTNSATVTITSAGAASGSYTITVAQDADGNWYLEISTTSADGSTVLSEKITLGSALPSEPKKFTFGSLGLIVETGSDLANLTASASASFSVTAGTTGTFHVGASSGDTLSVTIEEVSSSILGVNSLDVTTQSGAEEAITAIDNAIAKISEQRANLGAAQNRLEQVIGNLSIAYENTSAAESRIRDLDVAMETANYTRLLILQQAGIAMLAQANMLPQAALALIGGG